jgi:peptide/nickel transport system substrate-binding protein
MMNLTRRDMLAGAAALAAGGGLPAPATAQARGTLKVAPHANLQVLDPIWTTGHISRNHGYMIYDTLFALDGDLNPKPQMAESMHVSSDRTRYTVKLRDGLAWHDDTRVTAADCVASLTRWGRRDAMGRRLFDAIDRLEAQDDRTIALTLKNPYGALLDSLGRISSNVPFMMPARIAGTPADRQITETIGSGPFRFLKDEWKPGSLAVYEAFRGYVPRREPVNWASGGKIAGVERVEWHTMDANTAMNALLAGEIDYWEQVPPDLVPVVTQAQGVKVEVLDPLGNSGWARFNHLVAPTSNPKVRRAIMKALNQEDHLRTAIGNPDYYRVCKSIYPCDAPLASEEGWDDIAGNIADAKQLLKEAGYDNEEFVILQPTDHPVLNPFTLVTAEKLRAIGINVKLAAMDWSTLLQRRASKEPVANGGWNMFHTWWIGADLLNPLTGVGFAAVGDRGWFGWHKDDEAEKLRDAYAAAGSPEEARAIGRAFQKRLLEIGSHMPLGQFFVPVGYRTSLTGMIRSPVQFYWNMAKG